MSGIDRSRLPAAEEVGEEMHAQMRELYPFCRSLTGDGVRSTFDVLARDLPLRRTEVASGTRVYDWTVPPEWNIREAWIDDPHGRRIVDFADSNLHVLGYSSPVRAQLGLEELRDHLFSDPARPTVVPYRTSYHHENWGFCIAHEQLVGLQPGTYDVCIDSTLADGQLLYAECEREGESEDEVLVSTYVCHPSLCNDNLSGIVLTAALARHLGGQQLRHTYRFLFSPATIGPLTWLSHNESRLERIRHGIVACCVGDPGDLTYKRSRRGNATVDRAVETVLRDLGRPHTVLDFTPLGGDERQFCAPGFNLPVGVLSRSPADTFPEYHSSADDLDFVRPGPLGDSFAVYVEVLDALERNGTYHNLNPKGEPQLGKRGLYRAIGGGSQTEAPLLWVLNLSDGTHDLLDIASRSGLPFRAVADAADALIDAELLAPAR